MSSIKGLVSHQYFEVLRTVCDDCGVTSDDEYIISIIISVNADEVGGAEDEFDYCDKCFANHTQALKLVGSTAPVVTGEYPDYE
jgi:hypothetical protein